MNEEQRITYQVVPGDHVLIHVAAAIWGYTERAIQRKIQDGVWLEGAQWRRAPDGRIVIIRKGVEAWFTTGGSSAAKRSSRTSHTGL